MNTAHKLIDTALQLIRTGELARAFEVLEATTRDYAGSRDLNLLWGMYYIRKGNAQLAHQALEKELSIFPDHQLAADLLIELRQAISADTPTEISAKRGTVLVEKLRRAISSEAVKSRVLQVLSRLQPDSSLQLEIERNRYAIEHKSYWYEPITAIDWLAAALKPSSYLELGVSRGRCMAQVAVQSPSTKLFGVSLSVPHEAGLLVDPTAGSDAVKHDLACVGVNAVPTLLWGDSKVTLPAFLLDKNTPQEFDVISIDGTCSYTAVKQALEKAFAHLAPGGALVLGGIVERGELHRLWNECKTQYSEFLFLDQRYNHGTGIAIRPPFDSLEKALHRIELDSGSAGQRKLRLLMPYSVKRNYGKITLPEWLKDSLRAYYSNEVEVFACGPGNEIDIPDGSDFYQRVAPLIKELGIDALLDVEGGAETLDFMFKRFPQGISIPKVFWAIDTHQFLPLQIEKAKHYDVVYSAQQRDVEALGAKAQWLPAGASLHEVDLLRERTIPVAFVGSLTSAHARRTRTVEYLSQRLPELHVQSNIFLDEKAELLSRVKIAINVSLNNDVNFRVFETMATGAMLLTDRITGNGMESLFEEGVHYVAFDSDEDLLAKIQFYLTHPEEREKIARAGQLLVDSKYRHLHILRKVLDDISEVVRQNVHDVSATAAESVERKCWCGGALNPSVHPLYKQCGSCHTQVLDKIYTDEELKAFYSVQSYWRDRQMQVFNFPPIEERANNDLRDRIPVWFSTLSRFKKAPNRLLEIGCAHGGFLHYCREHGAKSIVGVEVDEATCQFARKRFNIEHVVPGLFPKVNLPFESFDAITGFDVIEHFLDPVEGLRGVADRLADDGICFFQTPWYRGEGGDWVQFKPAEHTFLYTEKAIRQLFEKVGLEVIDLHQGYFRDDMFVVGRKKAARKRVGFVRTDAIGDGVMATGMLAPIAQKYDTKLTVICVDSTAPLYENHPAVERVVAFSRLQLVGDEGYREQLQKILASLNLDIVLNSVYSRDIIADYISLACEAKESIALHGNLSNIDPEMRAKNNALYTRIIETSAESLPEIERHEEFLKALSIASPEVVPVIRIQEADRVVADRILAQHGISPEGLVVLGSHTSGHYKNYPYWSDVLADVCQEQGLVVVAVGGDKDRFAVQEILDRLPVKSLNLCGQTSLMESAAIISRAKIVVASDTSIPHIASALGVPNVVVVGGGHFGRFFPYSKSTSMVCLPLDCYGCEWRCKYSSPHCVKSVDPQVVAEAVRFTLEGTGAKPRVFMQTSSVKLVEPHTAPPRWKPFNALLNPEKLELVLVSVAGRSDMVSSIGRSLHTQTAVGQISEIN